MKKNRRTQILLTEKQYKKLHTLSEHKNKSIGFIIREAIDAVYIKEKKNREKIVEKIAAMNLPSGDWKEIKKEITKNKNK